MESPDHLQVMESDYALNASPSKPQPDVQKFMSKLKDNANNISTVFHHSRQQYNNLRTENALIENKNKETCNEIMNKVLDDLERLNKEFKKMVNEEKHENVFLR
jgi:hypothetical protein